MLDFVNGFPCADCTDVSYARRGIDPRNPHQDPVKQAALDADKPLKAVARDGVRPEFASQIQAVQPPPGAPAIMLDRYA